MERIFVLANQGLATSGARVLIDQEAWPLRMAARRYHATSVCTVHMSSSFVGVTAQ